MSATSRLVCLRNVPALGSLVLGLSTLAFAAGPSAASLLPPLPADDFDRPAKWNFEFLPRSFQKNPFVNMTVITEMTDAGRQRPAATPNQPVYYVTYNTPMHEEGRLDGGVHPPTPAVIEQTMQHALAVNGFLPADARHPPALLITYVWGVINHMAAFMDDVGNRNILARATLTGGTAYGARFQRALVDEQLQAALGVVWGPFSPMNQFKEQDPRNWALVDQTMDELYFLVASAYDYGSVARNQRLLLWRSRMTASAIGTAMADSLPTVIAVSAPYLGRDMTDTALLYRRAERRGRVEIGTLKVMGPPGEAKGSPEKK